MIIVAFGASSSRASINKKLALSVGQMFEGNLRLLDLNDYEMPIFSVDKEKETGYPKEAYAFIDDLSQADLIIISLAEHNGNYSAAFKNIFDWTSRIKPKIFDNKAVFLLSTSPGGRGGQSVMEAAKIRFPFHGAKIVATFSLPFFQQNFSDEGIVDPILREQLSNCVRDVKAYFMP